MIKLTKEKKAILKYEIISIATTFVAVFGATASMFFDSIVEGNVTKAIVISFLTAAGRALLKVVRNRYITKKI